MPYVVFRDNVYIPFEKAAWMCVILAYISFVVYNVLTSGYFLGTFFTNPSAFVGFRFLSVYLLFSSLVTAVLASGLYTYIEVGRYKQQLGYATEKRKMYEVKVPKHSSDGLASMEAFLETIAYSGGEGLWFNVWWKGRMRPSYSFEIISKGGIVYFYLNVREGAVDAVSSAFYAFFPNAQIVETNEYAFELDITQETHSLFGVEWKFSKNNILPIKTYVEFLLEKRKSLGTQIQGTSLVQNSPLVDPLSSMYDLLGSLRGDEQIWIQYVWRTQKYTQPEEKYSDDPLEKGYWKRTNLKEEISNALKNLYKAESEAKEKGEVFVLTPSEERLKTTGARLIEKSALEVGIRFMYITPKDKFNPGRINPLLAVYKLTNSSDNSLIPHGTELVEISSVPILEPKRPDKIAERDLILQLYRDRMFWHAPALFSYQVDDIKGKDGVNPPSKKRITTIMTTETFSTICHFPTQNIMTPTVRRTLSRNIDPPENLPI